jgi:hypothetical protein
MPATAIISSGCSFSLLTSRHEDQRAFAYPPSLKLRQNAPSERVGPDRGIGAGTRAFAATELAPKVFGVKVRLRRRATHVQPRKLSGPVLAPAR